MPPTVNGVGWRSFGDYSGPVIQGVDPIPPPLQDKRHVARAYWLTTKVETGAKFGAIVMYDGTGVTGGPDQHVAVYPRHLADASLENDQGGLWKLLRRLETAQRWSGAAEPGQNRLQPYVETLWNMFAEHGWFVSQDGALRFLDTGALVPGNTIRNVLTPKDGKVPERGPETEAANRWAFAFHDLLVHPEGRSAQVEFGMEHLVERTRSRRIALPSGNKISVLDAGYGDREITAIHVGKDWPEQLDLALCMYQSHSVNAPAIANRALIDASMAHMNNEPAFAKALIKLLGNSTFGRWDDDIEGGRYQRTRTAARASGLWDVALFDGPNAIMPKDLVG